MMNASVNDIHDENIRECLQSTIDTLLDWNVRI